MAIALTKEQQQAIDAAGATPPQVVDPRTSASYVLVPAEEYETVREVLIEERRQRQSGLWPCGTLSAGFKRCRDRARRDLRSGFRRSRTTPGHRRLPGRAESRALRAGSSLHLHPIRHAGRLPNCILFQAGQFGFTMMARALNLRFARSDGEVVAWASLRTDNRFDHVFGGDLAWNQ